MATILLIEDDAALAELMREYLQNRDFEVHVESRGDRAEGRVQALRPDVIVLDIGLPGLDGLSVCRQLRTWYQGPILVLTARGDEADEVVGFELGADDYVAKPVRPRALVARLQSLLRRYGGSQPGPRMPGGPPGTPAVPGQGGDDGGRQAPVVSDRAQRIAVGPLIVDAGRRSVAIGARTVEVTTSEFDLLWVLAQNAGRVMSRDQISSAVRGFGYDGVDRSIDLRVSRLRKKLGDSSSSPTMIKSVRGTGYILALPE